jgi:hypothetical protein
MADYDWKNGDPLTNWVVMSAVDDAEQRSSDIEIDGSVSRPNDLTEIDTGVNSRLADLMGEGGMKSPTKGTIDDVYKKLDGVGDWKSYRARYKMLQRQVLNINGDLATANVGTYHSLNGGGNDAKGAGGMVACLPLETLVKSMKAFGMFEAEGQRVTFDELLNLVETPAFLHDAQKWQDIEGDVYAVAMGSEEQLQADAKVEKEEEEEKKPEEKKFNGPTKADPQFDPNNTTDKYKLVYDEDSGFFEGVENPYYQEDPNKPKPKLELIDVEEPNKFNGPTKANPQFDPNNTTDKYKLVYDEESGFFEGVENPYYKEDPNKPKPKLELIDYEEPSAKPESKPKKGLTPAEVDAKCKANPDKHYVLYIDEDGEPSSIENPYYKVDPNKPKPKLELIDSNKPTTPPAKSESEPEPKPEPKKKGLTPAEVDAKCKANPNKHFITYTDENGEPSSIENPYYQEDPEKPKRKLELL